MDRLWKRFLDKNKIGSFDFRMKINAPERKWYAYILYNSAALAKKLQIDQISVIEYGVEKGRGLLILEDKICIIQTANIKINIPKSG